MDSVGKYQIVHPDGTKLSPVDMATLAEMVYAGIVQQDTQLFAVATNRNIKAGEIPYLAFLIGRLKESPSAPPPRLPVSEPARPVPQPAPPAARKPVAPESHSIPPPLFTPSELAAPAPQPEPITIPVASAPAQEITLAPLVFETPPTGPIAPPEPVLEVPPLEPLQAEPVFIELDVPEAPVSPEISWEVTTTAPLPETPAEPALVEPPIKVEAEPVATPSLSVTESPAVEVSAKPVPEPEVLPEVPPVVEVPPPTKSPPPKTPPPMPEAPPKKTPRQQPGKPLFKSPQQARTFRTVGIVALVIVGGLVAWQQITGAAAEKNRLALVGTWGHSDDTWVIFKDDGSGAMTRPDEVYGNRTHLFHWERQGDRILLTERRILMPGGTRQSATDAWEPITLSADGQQLHFSDIDLTKAPNK